MSRRGEPGITLADKVAFLRDPASYPDRPTTVEAIETHMSWLFLTPAHAWKLKKPYRHDLIDYATPAARERHCRLELRLNRRFAPQVYLAVVPLVVRDRRLALGGRGHAIDWLVKMRRLPERLTLEHALQSGALRAADIHRVVDWLAAWFDRAPRARIAPATYRRRLRDDIAATADELARPAFALPARRIATLADALTAFVAERGELLDARVRAGRIVEGHGDLRPEHIYLTDPPTVVDCIEFSRRLRQRDPVDELAFLASECDRLGHPEADGRIFARWQRASGDAPTRALVEFHKCRNALIRAKIAAWHTLDPDTGPRRPWLTRAREHLHHAAAYATRLTLQGGSSVGAA